MTAVASEGVPVARHRLRQRLRAAVLGPRGGGTTRRRASDAFRLGLAILVVAVSVPVMRANSAAELSIVRALNPPPDALGWLVTLVFWLGSAGVIALLVIVGLLVPRLTAVRRTAVAALATWGCASCWAPCSDRRPAGPLLAVCGGNALPVNAISSVALGWGVAAALHLAVGSPLGLPSAAEITEWITDLRVAVRDLTRAPRQVWGVEQFTGLDPAGNAVELAVYGRDASDASSTRRTSR